MKQGQTNKKVFCNLKEAVASKPVVYGKLIILESFQDLESSSSRPLDSHGIRNQHSWDDPDDPLSDRSIRLSADPFSSMADPFSSSRISHLDDSHSNSRISHSDDSHSSSRISHLDDSHSSSRISHSDDSNSD